MSVTHQPQHKSRGRNYVLLPWFICRLYSVVNLRHQLLIECIFGVMPTEICKRESAKRRDVKSQVCGHLCCDVTMSRFCHHSHQSACSEKADGWLKPSLRSGLPLGLWKKRNPTKTVSQMTTLILLHFLLYLKSGENFDPPPPSCGLMLKEKTLLCRNGSSSISHFMFWSEIFCIHLSLCVVQLYPDKNKCLPYKVQFVFKRQLCHLCTQYVTEQINICKHLYFKSILFKHVKKIPHAEARCDCINTDQWSEKSNYNLFKCAESAYSIACGK